MKTKLLVLSSILAVILSGMAIAGGMRQEQNVPDQSHSVVKDPSISSIATGDISTLKGRGFFYAEEGTLYKEAILPDGALATSSLKIATGVRAILDQDDNVVLFIKDQLPTNESSANELLALDKATGAIKKVHDNVIQEGKISPLGNLIAITTSDRELLVITMDGGSIVTKIGIHGGSPLFSPDGKKIAYIKLKDGPIEMGDQGFFQGIAVYDIATGEDTLIFRSDPSGSGNEYMVTGWSPDGKRVYFPSGGSTWSVSIDGIGKRQETNKDPGAPRVPSYLNSLFFTDNGVTAFGEASGLWVFHLGKDNEFIDARKAVEGTPGFSSRLDWLKKGESIVTHFPGKASAVHHVSDINQ